MALEIGQNPARLSGEDSYSLRSIVGPGVERAGGTTPISDGILGVLMVPGVKVVDDLRPDEVRVFETRDGSPKSVAGAKEFFRDIPESGKAGLARFLSQDNALAIRRDTAGGQGLTINLSALIGRKTELSPDIQSLSPEAQVANNLTSPPPNPAGTRGISDVEQERSGSRGGVEIASKVAFREIVLGLV